MDLLQLMSDRYSVRSFTDQAVEEDKIEKILQAARLAPTACNKQPQRILVLKDKEDLEKWQKCTVCHFNEQLVMLVCYDKDQCWKREYDGQNSGYVDASIVLTHMMLEATSLGIGSTWVMYFIPDAVRKEFNLPDNIEAVGALTMGYASEKAAPSAQHNSRKNIDEITLMQ